MVNKKKVTIPIETNVLIRAFGNSKSGKSYFISKIKKFLEKEGHTVIHDVVKDENGLFIQNKHEVSYVVEKK